MISQRDFTLGKERYFYLRKRSMVLLGTYNMSEYFLWQKNLETFGKKLTMTFHIPWLTAEDVRHDLLTIFDDKLAWRQFWTKQLSSVSIYSSQQTSIETLSTFICSIWNCFCKQQKLSNIKVMLGTGTKNVVADERPLFPLYTNYLIELQSKSVVSFLYDGNFCH